MKREVKREVDEGFCMREKGEDEDEDKNEYEYEYENKGMWKRREKGERIKIRINIKGYGKEKEEERREEAGWNEKMKSSMGSNSNTAILNGEMSSQIDRYRM